MKLFASLQVSQIFVFLTLKDVGQVEDWDAVKSKALQLGATKMFIEDLKKEFVSEFIFPA
jgi:argininosuccinate synthase